jgi:hypothetical protein
MSNYNPGPGNTPNYMSSDWGNTQAKYTAMNIDHIADKAKFAIQMLEGVVNGFDVIEKEIVDISQASVMPSREQIRAYAYRIDGQQQQIKQTLEQLKQMMNDIDRKTDNIQGQRNSW